MTRRAKIVAPKTFEIIHEEVPVPEAHEVQIRTEVVGLCSSEVEAWLAGNKAHIGFGHEVVGAIQTLGSDVEDFAIGDRVTGIFFQGFREVQNVSKDVLVRVSEDIDPRAAITEPLACVLSAVDKTDITLGDHAVVIGCSYMGLLTIEALKLSGVATITAIDPRMEAREHAIKHGATEAFAPNDVPESYFVVNWDNEMFERGVPLVFEVSGNGQALRQAGELCAIDGQLNIMGFHNHGDVSLDIGLWNWKALRIINGHERSDERMLEFHRRGQALLERGILDLTSLYTHPYALEEINRAFEQMVDRDPHFIKAYIQF